MRLAGSASRCLFPAPRVGIANRADAHGDRVGERVANAWQKIERVLSVGRAVRGPAD